MGPYADVFERVEKKFRIDAGQRGLIEEALARRMRPDERGLSLITSLYLDTPERSLISRSTEKPLYKEKVRLRAYGRVAGGALMEQVARAEAPPGSGRLADCWVVAGEGGRGKDQPVVFVEATTTNMGSLFRVHYEIRMREPGREKALIDELRCLNGNLKITLGRKPQARESL